jgi:pilus assembly protein CpaF
MSEEVMGVLLQHIARLEQQIDAIRQEQDERFVHTPSALHMDMSLPEAHARLSESERLTASLVQELSNMGPVQPLLEDDTVNDILINGIHSVYVERFGKLERTNITFPEDSQIMTLAENIVKAVGRQLNPSRPLVDARLLDGSRVNIIAPPLSVDGTTISIRKFSKRVITLDAMAEQKNISPQIAQFLSIVGKCRMNTIISGGTGSGKTTLLNAVSRFIEDDERVVTIEDAAELKLQQPHIVRLETKPVSFSANGKREDEVSMRDLVKNALRMRPDRIIVGEVRGAEAFDMMQAMNTGHEGSLTTIHANHPRDCLARLENMIGMANLGLPMRSIRSQIASAINIIVQISRMRDGKRRLAYVTEIIGMEGDIITMQDLFAFTVSGEGKDGFLEGDFKWSGIMPRFVRRAAYYGELDNLAQCLGVRVPKL